MVNIVVVSHSRKLAEGVIELASQMTQGNVKFALAAGIDDPDNPIGTDPVAVMAAIEDVLDDDVLVMVDMGSAILSTDMAKELLGEEKMARVQICAAPLVEGTVAAAVAAASGQTIGQVMAEAHQALAAKYAQLGQSAWLSAPQEAASPTATDQDSKSFSWTITNPTGIHARPASAIVRCLNQFDAEVDIVNGDRVMNARSMNNVVRLGIKCGDVITLLARGPQAQQAIDAFAALAATQFGDSDKAQSQPAKNKPAALEVTLCRINRGLPQLSPRAVEANEAEIARLNHAISLAKQELDGVIAATEQQLSAHEAAIFSAHQMMLEDTELYDTTLERLAQQPAPIEQLWLDVISQMADEYRAIEDAYLRERYIDVYDVGIRVLRLLLGHPLFTPPQLHAPGLIIANYLLPSEVMTLDVNATGGICFTAIDSQSHAAILAVARGIAVYIDSNGRRSQAWQDGALVRLATDSGEIMAITS
ncbi:dihydroxyacetone kinase phosphoryl donor subunit DhaM [Pantoea sp. At-9b]|uniref:dihydroxyacetone kinase phosphoryl donor subunit DhaM n=1 Tax=Pantoea sp. (strain At-9b) TaxID=592316 RepID=UPI0001B3EB29|nr:dihydroxyacetone kinase phosphoryl donor subunit DhaM [Pantoea sp. At-9b]ADU69596.1 dihydroxyacetone kinase, phosphotransfer subunit [Pantoea sp. At-9b]